MIYLAGAALAASFIGNRWLKGLGWLLMGVLIAMSSIASS